jgi:4-hydroxybenzoyl-CoA reductase subunit beta
MEALPRFQLHRPATVAAAVGLHRPGDRTRYVAGGTDLLVNVRRGIVEPETIIDLSTIAEMRAVTDAATGGLRIGGAVTLAELADHPAVKARFPVVATAALSVAATSHREVATVGGNLCLDTRCVFYNQSEWWRHANNYCLKYRGDVCHVAPTGKRCYAAFSGDLAPALLVLGASVDLAGPDGARTIPLDALYEDDGAAHLRLKEGEIVVAVTVPASAADLRADYAKARARGAIDFPLAGVAVALRRQEGRVADIKVAFTGTNSRPVLIDATADLAGRPVDDDALRRLEKAVSKHVKCMRSTFTAHHYRRRVALNLMRRLAVRLATD